MKNDYAININLCRKMDISPSEMMVLENIHFLSNNTGWCFGKKKTLALHHGYSYEGFRKLCKKLESKELLKTNQKGHLKTTILYADFMSVEGVQQSCTKGVQQSGARGYNKVGVSSIKIGDEGKVEVADIKIYETYRNLWNDMAVINGLNVVAKLSPTRIGKIKARIEEAADFEKLFPQLLEKITDSRFLTGANDREWKINLDWLIKNDTNYLKVIEGEYNDR